MIDPSEATREFHEFFGLPVRFLPTALPEDELALRKTLIKEEYDEFMEALDENDLIHAYKEAADLIYVVFGWDQHAGNLLSQVFAEVHRSNMTKLWPCEACDGRGFYMNESCAPQQTTCPHCEGSGKEARYREDGKVLKSPDYEEPDLSFIGHAKSP